MAAGRACHASKEVQAAHAHTRAPHRAAERMSNISPAIVAALQLHLGSCRGCCLQTSSAGRGRCGPCAHSTRRRRHPRPCPSWSSRACRHQTSSCSAQCRLRERMGTFMPMDKCKGPKAAAERPAKVPSNGPAKQQPKQTAAATQPLQLVHASVYGRLGAQPARVSPNRCGQHVPPSRPRATTSPLRPQRSARTRLLHALHHGTPGVLVTALVQLPEELEQALGGAGCDAHSGFKFGVGLASSSGRAAP